MAKTIKVLVNTGNEETNKVFDVTQGSGKKGNPTSIKAIKGARYHLEDPAAKNVGPENIRSKRVNKLPQWLKSQSKKSLDLPQSFPQLGQMLVCHLLDS